VICCGRVMSVTTAAQAGRFPAMMAR
jgi:hypothetical protein